jgi:hypothetical protein
LKARSCRTRAARRRATMPRLVPDRTCRTRMQQKHRARACGGGSSKRRVARGSCCSMLSQVGSRTRLGTPIIVCPGSIGFDSSSPVLHGGGRVANEYWLDDEDWAPLEPLMPLGRRGVGCLIAFEMTPGQKERRCPGLRQASGAIACFEPPAGRYSLRRRSFSCIPDRARHPLQGPQCDRTSVLPPQGLAARRDPLRQAGQEFPFHHSTGRYPHLVDVIEARA